MLVAYISSDLPLPSAVRYDVISGAKLKGENKVYGMGLFFPMWLLFFKNVCPVRGNSILCA